MLASKFLVGIMGATSVEVAHNFPSDGNTTSEIIKIVVQLVIGIATLVGLFKKPKTPKP